MKIEKGWYYFPVKDLKKEHLKFLIKSKVLENHEDLREYILVLPKELNIHTVFTFWHDSFLEGTDIKLDPAEVGEIITLMAVNKGLAYAYIEKYQTN